MKSSNKTVPGTKNQTNYRSEAMMEDIKRGFLPKTPKRGTFLASIALLALDILAIRGYALQLHNKDVFALATGVLLVFLINFFIIDRFND